MKLTTEATTVRHNVGTCPACREFLWAEVDIVVDVGEPTMTRDGAPIVNTHPRIVGMRVEHRCEGGRDDEGTWV